MDKPKTTPKDFFLWVGAMVSLYWSVLAFVFLIFSYIDYAFPDALRYYPANPYESGISSQMASIIVLLPLYLVLVRIIARDAVKDPSRREIWVRRWAIIFTLFIAGVAMAGDLITVLTSFLSGDALTTAFMLKVLVVLLVAAGVFMHFIADLKGYWTTYPMRRRYVSVGVGVLAIVAIVSGFFIVGTPQQARQMRFDDQKVQDLQNIDSQITYYYQAKEVLPASLQVLSESTTLSSELPVDPQTGGSYTYEVTGKLAFKLCAVFNREGGADALVNIRAVAPMTPGAAGNWQHGTGEQCFVRTIDPAFYPPLSKYHQ